MDRFQRWHANMTKLFYLEKSILSRYPLDSRPAQVIRNCNRYGGNLGWCHADHLPA